MKRHTILAALACVTLAAILLNAFPAVVAATVVSGVIGKVTGAPVKVSFASADLLHGRFTVRGLKIFQPKGFPKGTLLDAPSVLVEVDPGSFFTGHPHVTKLKVEVHEIVVIKNKDGALNVDALKVARHKPQEGEKKPVGRVQIDLLVLSVDRVVHKDLSRPKPLTEVYDLNIREVSYRDIPGASEAVSIILVQSLKSTAIKGALIYGTAAIAGIAILPVGAAFLMAGKDDAYSHVKAGVSKSLDAAAKTLREMGEIKEEDRKSGKLKGSVEGAEVTVFVNKGPLTGSDIRVTARKMLMPQPRTASGVLYEITERVKGG